MEWKETGFLLATTQKEVRKDLARVAGTARLGGASECASEWFLHFVIANGILAMESNGGSDGTSPPRLDCALRRSGLRPRCECIWDSVSSGQT